LSKTEEFALRDELRASGANAEFFKHNVTEASEWDAAVKMAVDSFGGLDAVVNAAAIVPMKLLEDLDVEEFKKVQDVNVAGTLLGCKHASIAMRPGGISGRGGSIINLSSVMGLSGSIALASITRLRALFAFSPNLLPLSARCSTPAFVAIQFTRGLLTVIWGPCFSSSWSIWV
jgi:NAD(P)-dependent dehydrogenase (short-subunit alcohol dehydrogenase family)